MSDQFEVLDIIGSEIPVTGPQGIQSSVSGMPASLTVRCVSCDKEFEAKRATNGAAGTFMKLGGTNTYQVSCPSGKHRGTVSVPTRAS